MPESVRRERDVLFARVWPPQIPAIPSWTSAGAFGIARTTRRPEASAPRSTRSSRRRRPKERLAGVTLGRDLVEHGDDVLRLDGENTSRRPPSAATFDDSATTPYFSCSSVEPLGRARGDDELVRPTPAASSGTRAASTRRGVRHRGSRSAVLIERQSCSGRRSRPRRPACRRPPARPSPRSSLHAAVRTTSTACLARTREPTGTGAGNRTLFRP